MATGEESEKLFEMKHSVFDKAVQFTDTDPPSWLVCRENRWFWEEHVLTLEVGQSIPTDFQLIKRLR